jgi:hypothetical protein
MSQQKGMKHVACTCCKSSTAGRCVPINANCFLVYLCTIINYDSAGTTLVNVVYVFSRSPMKLDTFLLLQKTSSNMTQRTGMNLQQRSALQTLLSRDSLTDKTPLTADFLCVDWSHTNSYSRLSRQL